MNSNDIVGLVAVIGIFLIPSIGLTARFALKPIVESILKIRQSLDQQQQHLIEDPRVPALQQEVLELRETVERLEAAASFDAELRLSAGGAPKLPGAES